MHDSPFPGMDPYLEAPTLWSGVQTRLITAIADDLAERVAPHFIVGIEARVYIVADDDGRRSPIVPDVYVAARPGPERAPSVVATITPPTRVRPLPDPEVRERFIEIRDAASRELVTTIEILSPDNKLAGTTRRVAFLEKRATLMASSANWIEIDLLRAGARPPEAANQSDYYALLWRGRTAEDYEVWFVDLRDRPPTIAVPLRPPFADVALDLQALLAAIYRRGRYADSLDYDQPPPPPRLKPAEAAWAANQIARWRLTSAQCSVLSAQRCVGRGT